ncbi:DUF1295 domain-containing protein [Rhodobacter sp. HX-7-19]|uniref:DUF1295 domain-containing protein n=1 Tax=Paragemmobacter kunshanensis TaxID=2583234 RepID=A0A6M1TNR0_9RHOB|nr:isoprenylcysteine carboxylmethyltransferase family protein [Rhodobacter kunshanensis]NGQ89460.1 DUF1295 domain-containing protein [Rhodobacter kunshanensis]
MRDQGGLHLPKSVTPAGVALASVASFLTSFGIVWFLSPFDGTVASVLFILGSMVVATFAVDLGVYKVHRRASTGMDYGRRDLAPGRAAVKLLGLYASVGFVALLWAILPIYREETYQPFLTLAQWAALPLALLSVPYVLFVDAHQADPRDGYWQMGKAVLLDRRAVDGAALWLHLRGWIVKGFFLPLMFGYFCSALEGLRGYDPATLADFVVLYGFLYSFAFFFDLSVSTIGYATTFRPLDTHMRSTEPTALGWVVCIICYAPIWAFLQGNYLDFETDWEWGNWLWNSPLAYGAWGVMILGCLSVYVYATAQFGCRFSNLTHRGIITSGPYRWTKHPAYVFKNISWWLIAIPFIPGDGEWQTAVRNCLLLAGVSGIYVLRARTEERHLSMDPDYVAYARWIEENGIFRRVRAIPGLGWLAYRGHA